MGAEIPKKLNQNTEDDELFNFTYRNDHDRNWWDSKVVAVVNWSFKLSFNRVLNLIVFNSFQFIVQNISFGITACDLIGCDTGNG